MQPRIFTPTVVASILAILVVGVTAWYVFGSQKEVDEQPLDAESVDVLDAVRPVQEGDHVQGNPNASLVFVVYSDFGCPFCKDFHNTMSLIVDAYGKEGQVAWVFRHMPIIQLHPEAATYALASECVAEQGGNSAFWTFADALFAASEPTKTLDQQQLLSFVDDAGVSRTTFVECMRTGELMREVEDDFKEAILAGAEGTPFTLVISPQQRFVVEGTQNYRSMAGAIESVLPILGAETITPPSMGNQSEFLFDAEQRFFEEEEAAKLDATD